MNKALQALTVGYHGPARDNWFTDYLDPFAWDWDHKLRSLVKPWYVFGAVSFFFFARHLLFHVGSPQGAVIGIGLPLILAARQTYYSLAIWIGGPGHERSSFYTAGAVESGLMAAHLGSQAFQNHAEGKDVGWNAAGAAISGGQAAVMATMAAHAYEDEMIPQQREEPLPQAVLDCAALLGPNAWDGVPGAPR